jgi:hypothetical protein
MLRKLIFGLAAAASLSAIALAPTAAFARHGGSGGSGGAGGFHATQQSQGMRVRFLGPPVQRGFHRRHWLPGFGLAYAAYTAPYFDDRCYVVRRVPTPYGYRLRIFNVCRY